jgi:alpha-beta hydrolase superfamily lysophospholipase
MFRTRFKEEIPAEFLPASRTGKKQKLIILCDGMPSIPHKQPLAEFLAAKGFWVIYLRYRGAWESGGEFLAKSPHEDALDILDELPSELEEIAFGKRYPLTPDQIFVIGESFGGAAAILLSLDSRITRVVANCPVTDWGILDRAEEAETSKEMPRISARHSGVRTGCQTRTGKNCGAEPSTILGTTETKSILQRSSCFTQRMILMCHTRAAGVLRKLPESR